MTVKFVKAHTGSDGRNYTVGQLTEIKDAAELQNLIRQGIVREQSANEPPTESEK